MTFSVVIPCYKSPMTLRPLCENLVKVFNTLKQSYEIVLIDDGCPMNSWEQIALLSQENSQIKGIRLSRNFGQHSAISCGLQQVQGDYTIIMDCDGQDEPQEIIPMFELIKTGNYEIVQASRIDRKISFFKKMQSWLFYRCLSFFLGVSLNHQIGNYGIYSKKVVTALGMLKDRIRFIPYQISWVGYSKTTHNITQQSRMHGTSSYSLMKALRLALDISISSSGQPIYYTVFTGCFISLASFLFAIYYIIKYFIHNVAPTGWTTLIVLMSFSTGAILMSMGVIGLYLVKTFDQTKQRPIYLIDHSINL